MNLIQGTKFDLGPVGVLENPAPWAGGCAREPSTLGRQVC